MKIFISHSSLNAMYGDALVELLTGVGVKDEEIIFTSNDAYGIPIGKNIFQWLKERINEKPFVLYLLSPDYYKSVACLNEMGAAWIIESKHAMLFTPDFKLDSSEFQNGAIDPREIGFYISNYNKLLAFIESLRAEFTITSNPVLISQKINSFLDRVKIIEKKPEGVEYSVKADKVAVKSITAEPQIVTEVPTKQTIPIVNHAGTKKLLQDLLNNKLRPEKVILLHYISENSRFKLYYGWQEHLEIEKIVLWEDINELNSTLSAKYHNLINRLSVKGLIEVSATTSHGNPKEYKIVQPLADKLIDLEEIYKEKIHELLAQNN